MSRFPLVCRLSCLALFVCLLAPPSYAQFGQATIDHNTTINDATYANLRVSVVDGPNPPTVVSIEGSANILGMSVGGTSIVNIHGGQIGSGTWESSIDSDSNTTVNYYGGVFNYSPLRIGGTMNLYAPLHANIGFSGGPQIGTVNVFGVSTGMINIANVNISGDASISELYFTGQATISGGVVYGLVGSGVANITGGTVYYDLASNLGGTVNVFGGIFGLRGGSSGRTTGTINVYGGTANPILASGGVANFHGGSGGPDCFPGSVGNIYGGSVSGNNEGGILNYYGGSIGAILTIGGNGTTNFYGGAIKGPLYYNSGAVNFYGRGLIYDTVNNVVTGTLRDGTTVNCPVVTFGMSAVINLINDPPASVSGILRFDELTVNAPPQNATFTFRPANGAASVSQTIAVSPFGSFTVPNLPRQAGVLHIKPERFLAVNVPIDLSGGDVSGLNAILEPGDANNDNACDVLDFGILVNAYGAKSSDPGYDAACDFNGDNRVDIVDFGILVNAYGSQGDP